MVKQIQNLEIDEISLVKKGANQHAKVAISKSAQEGTDMDPDLYNENGDLIDSSILEHGDVIYDEEGNAYAFEADGEEPLDLEGYEFSDGSSGELLSDQEPELVGKAAMPTFLAPAMAGVKTAGASMKEAAVGAKVAGAAKIPSIKGKAGSLPGKMKGAMAKPGFRIGAGVGAGAGAAGITGAMMSNRRQGFGKSMNGAGMSYADEVREELSKALTDRDRDSVISKALGQMEEMDTITKSALQIASDERDLRLSREYTEIAKSYNMPIEDDILGEVLKHCAELLSDQDCEVIAKCLDTAGQVLFDEYGAQGGGSNSDIYSQVEAAVASNVSKSGGSQMQEITKFLEENPEAYDQYLAEQNAR